MRLLLRLFSNHSLSFELLSLFYEIMYSSTHPVAYWCWCRWWRTIKRALKKCLLFFFSLILRCLVFLTPISRKRNSISIEKDKITSYVKKYDMKMIFSKNLSSICRTMQMIWVIIGKYMHENIKIHVNCHFMSLLCCLEYSMIKSWVKKTA